MYVCMYVYIYIHIYIHNIGVCIEGVCGVCLQAAIVILTLFKQDSGLFWVCILNSCSRKTCEIWYK